ncbi:MAG TPA: beta-galactosidase [Roseiflexaceae bacterium]|nr:beta-galactosidase [Roseiflexaceae bacterium]
MMFTIHRGVVHVDGQPRVCISADYPYYRDAKENWADRLRALRDLGVGVVSCYLPWRHHQPLPDAAPDFSGETQPNRDVYGFFELCRSLGLAVIAKPGPFIHAEANYGGLPDWVCPLFNPSIEPSLRASGEPLLWMGARLDDAGRVESWPLPAPFAPTFLALTREWLARAGAVIQRGSAPDGPVVFVQVANEGIYSDGQHAPWAYDYSASALALFRRQLAARYEQIERYNSLHGSAHTAWEQIAPPRTWSEPAHPRGLLAYMDWGLFQADYLGEAYRVWGEAIGTALPLLVNLNPPLGEHYGHDAWLTRVVPERWPGVHYGYTNWIGVVSADPSAYDRYLLLTKRAPGVNLEENWGFSILYEPAYIDAAASFYQTLLALCGGATGFNVYTGVATDAWDDNIDIGHERPYPDCPPITAAGELTPKAETLRWMTAFFDRYGAEFLACRPPTEAAWGIYLPYAQIAAWSGEDGAGAPLCGRALGRFQAAMRALRAEYELLDLQTATVADLLRFPRLALGGGCFMERGVQEKLTAYARAGGQLGIVGELPSLDEEFVPWAPLAELGEQIRLLDEDYAAWLGQRNGVQVTAGQADVWLRSHAERDLHFVVVLLPTGGTPVVDLRLTLAGREHRLHVAAAPGGAALLRVERGALTDAVVKGLNGFLGHAIPPRCVLDDVAVELAEPADIAWIAGETLVQGALCAR